MISLGLALVAAPTFAQDLALPVLSPAASVSQDVGTVTVTVDYSSPARRDRTIFGELVPYGEVWRTGANGATTLTLTGDATVGGVDVAAGSYALMSIPGEEEWTFILTTDLSVRPWKHDEKLDLPRFTAKPVEGADRERLTFLFADTTDRASQLHLEWAGVAVPIAIEVDTTARAKADIDGFVGGAARRLAQAAMFQVGEEALDDAVALARKAVAVDDNWYTTFTLAKVLHARDEHKEAYKAAKKAKELGADDDNFFYEDAVDAALESWPKK